MVGFFNKFTEASNYYIDWSRIGTLFTAHHKYSKNELLVRGSMLSFTIASGILGAYFNDEEISGYSDTTIVTIAATLGFIIAHIPVITPLVMKRYKISKQCESLCNEIKTFTAQHGSKPQKNNINFLCQHIISLSLANENRSNASQTWGYRYRLLNNLKIKIS